MQIQTVLHQKCIHPLDCMYFLSDVIGGGSTHELMFMWECIYTFSVFIGNSYTYLSKNQSKQFKNSKGQCNVGKATETTA